MKPDVGRQGTRERPPSRDTKSVTTLWSYPETVEKLVPRDCVAPANQRVKTDAPPGHRLPAAPFGPSLLLQGVTDGEKVGAGEDGQRGARRG
jgi:hypothetical protein